MLSSLSLSNKPILPNHAHNTLAMANGKARSATPNPIFGLPSLASAAQIATDGTYPDTAMVQDFIDFDDGEFTENDDADMDADADEKEKDPNAMDWSPIAPANRDRRRRSLRAAGNGQVTQQVHSTSMTVGRWDDGAWLRPQKFFLPEEPTGLEGLFEKTITLADDALRDAKQPRAGQSRWTTWMKGRWSSSASQ